MMLKEKRLFAFGIILLMVMMLGVGYAALNNRTLNVNGSATVETDDDNFKVYFTSSEIDSDSTTTGVEANATINDKDSGGVTIDSDKRISAVMNITSGFKSVGDKAVGKYIIKNGSVGIGANISLALEDYDNTNGYFKVSYEMADGVTTINAGSEATLIVTVELVKPFISTTLDSDTATFKVDVTASPVVN